MQRFLAPLAEPAYAAFRIVIGVMFAMHGMQKHFGILGGFAGQPGVTVSPSEQPQLFAGGLIELACGTLVAVGLLTRWAAFLASGTMAVAYFQFHQTKGGLPIQNGGELAVAYCFAFLVIATRGPGRFALACCATRPEPAAAE